MPLHNYIVDNDPKKPMIMGHKYQYENEIYWFMGYSQTCPEDRFYQWTHFISASLADTYEEANNRFKLHGEDLGLSLDTDTMHHFKEVQ